MDFQTIKSLAFTFAPFLLSYGYSHYRSLKQQSAANRPARRPTPPHVRTALNFLLFGAVLSLSFSLPFFAPENIIHATGSRLQTPSDVLWRRVSLLRPGSELTAMDEELRSRLTSIDGRCLYLVYGPDTTASCPFCRSDDPRSYLIYALPSMLLPHLLNIANLGVATSSAVAGKEGSRWRMYAVLAGFVFSVVDIYMFYSYDPTRNARATRPEDLTNFYWNMRATRFVGIALLEIVVAGLIWASATNRLFVTPFTAAERLDRITQRFQIAAGKTGGAGIIQNAAMHDSTLRSKYNAHWERETTLMREVMSDEQVQHSVRAARSSGRVNTEGMERDARAYAEGLIEASQSGTS